jgi:hypothetical protein
MAIERPDDRDMSTVIAHFALFQWQLDELEVRALIEGCEDVAHYILRALSVYRQLSDDGRITFEGDPSDDHIIILTGKRSADG